VQTGNSGAHTLHAQDTKTCGVIFEDPSGGITKVAEPAGVIAGIVPTTNPTSTAIFKSLLALKTRNSLVLCPHPRAAKSTVAAARIVRDAAVAAGERALARQRTLRRPEVERSDPAPRQARPHVTPILVRCFAGAPEDIISFIETPSLPVSQALMQAPEISLILATGGPAMVRAAYSSGHPSLGVGAGNTPALIDDTADIQMAVSSIMLSKTFDNGVICASEQSVVVVDSSYDAVRAEFVKRGAYFLTEADKVKVGRRPGRPEVGVGTVQRNEGPGLMRALPPRAKCAPCDARPAGARRCGGGRQAEPQHRGPVHPQACGAVRHHRAGRHQGHHRRGGRHRRRGAAVAGAPEGCRSWLVGSVRRLGKVWPCGSSLPRPLPPQEKLCPILAMYRAKDFDQGLDMATRLIMYGGAGHTSVLYTSPLNTAHINAFSAAAKTVRILINTPASQGAIGDV
jgi:acyl-CoA reductase-like NAD-dependent aldehyde dehydrogenase